MGLCLCPVTLAAPGPWVGGEVDAAGLFDGDVGVDLRRGRVGVAEKVLH